MRPDGPHERAVLCGEGGRCAGRAGGEIRPRARAGSPQTRQILEPVDQHIRFLRELRPGTPYFLRGGVVAAETLALTSYCELVQTASGEVAATFRTVVAVAQCRDRQSSTASTMACAPWRCITRSMCPRMGRRAGLNCRPPRDAPTLAEADSHEPDPDLSGHGAAAGMRRERHAAAALLHGARVRRDPQSDRADHGPRPRRAGHQPAGPRWNTVSSIAPFPRAGDVDRRPQRAEIGGRENLCLGALAVRCRDRRGHRHRRSGRRRHGHDHAQGHRPSRPKCARGSKR